MFRGISKLGAGESMTVTAAGELQRRTWWDPMPSAAPRGGCGMSEPEMVAEVRHSSASRSASA
jgi:hypothetical protein